MWRQKYSFYGAVFFIISTHVCADENVDEPFPDIFSTFGNAVFFHSDIKIISKHTNEYFFVQEFLNINTNQGRLKIKLKEEKEVVYLAETGEVFYIFDDICRTTNFEDPLFSNFTITNSSTEFLKWNNFRKQYKESPIFLGPSTSLLIPNSNNTKFLGETNNTSTWECNTDDLKFIYSVNLEESFLQIEIKSTDPNIEIHYFYDYISFGKDEINQSLIDIPVGYGCKRNNSKLTPAPSFERMDFKYSVEIKNSIYNYTYIATSIQDTRNKLNSFIYSEWNGSHFGDSILKIFEEKAGIQYVKDLNTGSCKYERISNFKEQIYLPSPQLIDLTDPTIINNPIGFSLIKEGIEREIPAYFYERVIPGKQMTIIRIYSKESVHNKEIKARSSSEKKVKEILPLKVIVKPITKDLQKKYGSMTFNYFDLSVNEVQWNSLYDVTYCFTKKAYPIKFRLEVKDPEEFKAFINSQKENERFFVEQLYEKGQISPLRISNLMMHSDDNFIFFQLNLLDRFPGVEDFNSKKGYFSKHYYVMYELVDTEECARYCLETRRCSSFIVCGYFCYLYGSLDDTNDNEKDESCFLYEKKEDANTIPTLDTVYKNLGIPFEDIDVTFEFVVNDNKKVYRNTRIEIRTYPLKAIEISTIKDKKRIHIYDFDLIYKFYKDQRLQFKPAVSKIIRHVPYEECQKLCLNDPQCKSFSSCYDDNECILTTKSELNLEDTQPNSQCLIIIKKDYASYTLMDGLVNPINGDEYLNAELEEDCATACSNSTKFACHSFDYCAHSRDDNKRCILRSTYDVETADTNDTVHLCGHYKRDYSLDFTVRTNTAMEGQFIEQIVGEDFKKCANLCLDGKGCKSFDYCQEAASTSTKCIFFFEDGTNFIKRESCDHYEKLAIEEPKRHSTKIAISCGVLFTVIGVCLGIMLCETHRRRRNIIK